MSETWRRKAYYDPRVLLPIAEILDCPFPDSIVCLTGAELSVLRNLCQYLHRRSTWVDEYHTTHYLAPSEEQWDKIEAFVAELEDTLMGCQGITEQLAAIATALTQLGAGLEEITVNVVGLSDSSNPDKHTSQTDSLIEWHRAQGALQESDPYGDTVPAQEDERFCAIGQLTVQAMYEFLTEIVQPAQKKAVDVLLPAALVTIGGWVGTAALGIPIGAFLATLWAAIDVWVAGSLQDVETAVFSNKDDIYCAIYSELQVGGDFRSAEAKAMEVVGAIQELSPIDKVLIHCLLAPWAMSNADNAWTNQTAWATGNYTPGGCDVCPGLEGDTWYAIPVIVPSGDLELDHETPGSYWAKAAVCGTLDNTATVCGFVVQVREVVGGLDLKMMNGEAGDCTGGDLAVNSSTLLTQGVTYYWYKAFTHDEDDAISALCPGAPKYNQLYAQTGPGTWRIASHYGWTGEGYALSRVKYVVYEK